MVAKTQEMAEIEIAEIKTSVVGFNMIGTSPLIMHRFAFKAWQELLLPTRRGKNQTDLDENLKHDPFGEYRECLYLNREDDAPTLFHVPAGMIHGAIKSAALDMKGTKKTEIGRWVTVAGAGVLNVYGTPQLFTTMARNSGMNSTPDVRTRAIFPQWAIRMVMLEYKRLPLTDAAVLNLMAAAGVTVGCGDWRPQKGGSYGKFRLCNDDDPLFQQIMAEQGRPAQQAAYDDPEYYDGDTRAIIEWFRAEIVRRDRELPSETGKVKTLKRKAS